MCNIREVGNMNNTVSLTKQNGEKIQAEIISYFEIVNYYIFLKTDLIKNMLSHFVKN